MQYEHDLDEVRKKYNLGRLFCTNGTCQGAVSLITAAFSGCLECIQKHIDETGKKGEKGMTALMHAVQQGYLDIVRILAEKEAGMQDWRN